MLHGLRKSCARQTWVLACLRASRSLHFIQLSLSIVLTFYQPRSLCQDCLISLPIIFNAHHNHEDCQLRPGSPLGPRQCLHSNPSCKCLTIPSHLPSAPEPFSSARHVTQANCNTEPGPSLHSHCMRQSRASALPHRSNMHQQPHKIRL